MARRRKHPKLPNGFGSIKYMGKGRRNPYSVHPPTKNFNDNGSPLTPKALCYVDDWWKGFAVLVSYKAGTYKPGDEVDMIVSNELSNDDLASKVLANFNRIARHGDADGGKTFAEIYDEFFVHKYERDKSRTYSKASISSTKAAFNNCKDLHDKVFKNLKYNDLQAVVDNCTLSHASKELMVSLIKQMYSFALVNEYVERDFSTAVKINTPDDDEHGEPFTELDLEKLWRSRSHPIVEMILIMCYSGYRIIEYTTMEVNLEEGYFRGGVKTKSGKDRIVPIHSSIDDLVRNRIARDGSIMAMTTNTFRKSMYKMLEMLKIEKHTPHDCRHTFSMLCEKYGVSENDRKRMLGHSFSGDITNGIYGHRSIEDLRKEIEKIKTCC